VGIGRRERDGEADVIVLGIETSTPQTTVALGTEQGTLASTLLSSGRSNHEMVGPAVDHLLHWTETDPSAIGGIAVGIGPGLFTGLRVGVQTAKTLAQALRVPIVGMASLDILAFGVRHSSRIIAAAIDARRGEVFYCLYRAVPGGVTRVAEFQVASPALLEAELEAVPDEVLMVGDGAIRYRKELEALSHVEIASPALGYPHADELVELSIPRFHREEFDRVADVVPLYLRQSDAEIAWDRRARTG
jgi:tRNA threonylcarbamoyladenosine biosynthesis protein TsaB